MLVLLGALSPITRAQTPTPPCTDKPATTPGDSRHTLVSRNQTRSYVQYVPENYDRTQPTPLILSLHGIISDGEQMRDYTGWNADADEHNFIVVYPEALFPPSLFVFFPLPEDVEDPVDDVTYITDLLSALRHTFCIDDARVYLSGFSAGGAMSLYLACALPQEFAAVGVMSAVYIEEFNEPTWCARDVPMPLIAFHGTDDSIVPYNGGDGFGWQFVPFETWTVQWALGNGCNDTPVLLDTTDNVRSVYYGGCHAEVIAYTLEGGGHAWAGGEPPRGIDPIPEPNATELMWAFFVHHPRALEN
jgi:polyhydroxybutyrate depolymerase